MKGKPTYNDLLKREKQLEERIHELEQKQDAAAEKYKKTEDALKHNREKLLNIFQSSPDAIMVYDFNGKIIEFNRAAIRLHGYSTKKQFEKVNCFALIASQHKKRASKGTRYLLKKGYLRNQQLLLLRKDGSTFFAEISTNILKDVNSKPIAYVSVIKDISKRIEIETDLRVTQYSIENAAFPVFWIRPDASFIYVNKAAYESLGYTKEELLTMKVFDIDPRFKKNMWKEHWGKQKKQKSLVLESIHKHKDGTLIPVELAINHFMYEGEEFSFTFVSNISRRKDYESKLKEAKVKAEESDKLKSAFLSNMSHEIRTPMNAILGFSKLLTQPDLAKEKKNNFVNIINNSSNTLLRLIDDIIDVSKIEAEQIKINKVTCKINKVLDELFIFYNSKAQNKNLQLTLKKSIEDDDFTLFTDQQRLNQIISNFLDNALKFTDKGFIEFGYFIVKEENKVLFYVKDTGLGIPKNMQRVIFSRFRQVDSSSTRKFGGTGLGLTISKKLVGLLGGELWVESAINQGSTFYFNLPVETEKIQIKPSQTKIVKQKQYNWEEKIILIAEDVEYNFEFLKTILEDTKVKIIWAKNGVEAVQMFKENLNIDLILMDIRMPEMNGYEATSKIKALNKKIPVISQTAYAVEGEREKSFKAGCNDYISKPIREQELLEVIDKYI